MTLLAWADARVGLTSSVAEARPLIERYLGLRTPPPPDPLPRGEGEAAIRFERLGDGFA